MGKLQQDGLSNQLTSVSVFYTRCAAVFSRISDCVDWTLLLVSMFTLSLLLSGVFWMLPYHSKSGFDADDAIKLSAPVQAYFRLPKPVSELVPHIGRLEYDITAEIGVPDTKVAILSMHQSGVSNWTDIVFGVLSDPINIPINSVSLSLLRSSLIELFLQQSNLTLTSSIFGQPSMFEILKFPGGVTVIPLQSASIWQIRQILFNFTLSNSISDIEENFVEFKAQLRFGLHLKHYENVYVLITNNDGSTISSPITIQSSVLSDMGSLLPQRLKQLAQAISDSPSKNLGLDHSIFGKVNRVSLSSILKDTLEASPPLPLPCPSPVPSPEPSISPYPAQSPSDSHHLPPCVNCEASSPSGHGPSYAPRPSHKRGPQHSKPPASSFPALPSAAPQPCPCHHHRSPASLPPSHTGAGSYSPKMAPVSPLPPPLPPKLSPLPLTLRPTLPPKLSPLPHVSYGSSSGHVPSPLPPSPVKGSLSSLAVANFYKEILLLEVSAIMIYLLFCSSNW